MAGKRKKFMAMVLKPTPFIVEAETMIGAEQQIERTIAFNNERGENWSLLSLEPMEEKTTEE